MVVKVQYHNVEQESSRLCCNRSCIDNAGRQHDQAGQKQGMGRGIANKYMKCISVANAT